MTFNEKILKALKSATKFLENSIIALSTKNKNALTNNMWHLKAELEYILFLFAIKFGSLDETPRLKSNLKLKTELELILSDLKNLLADAENLVSNGKLPEAYEKVYCIREALLKIKEDLR